MLAVLLLGISLMNYQKPIEQAGGQLGGIDVMIAIDVSNSMMATDLQPNRLEKARLFASKLMDTLQGNRIGIVAFAGEAFVQLPLTTDIAAARIYLQSLTTGLIPVQGTNIFKALETCRTALNPAEKKYKAVVLLTDGEELDDNAMAAAKALKNEGIVLITLGVGSANGATLPTETGEPRTNERGEIVVSKLNETLLKQLAEATYGTYLPLQETNATVAAVQNEIGSMDKKPISNARLINYESWSHPLIAFAAFLLLLELLLPAKAGRLKTRKSFAAALLMGVFFSPQTQAQNTDDLLRKANDAYLQQHYDDAKKMYEAVLKTDPKNAVARYNIGNMAYRSKNFTESANNFKAVTDQKPEPKIQAGAYNNAGLSHANAEEKNLPKAIESFKQSIRQNPYDDEVRNNLYKALDEWKQQQQQQQNKPDSNKKKPPPPKNKFDQKQADQKLQALQQEEKRIRDKMTKPAGGKAGDKNW